ncbi:hypothetical protein AVEN_156652-1 [Araneus ventricosus]|uniref:Uncharacterized protein n=1 Tax=Araneus ventricosus TaxID=182803 RepID=A0A4Y2KKC0_ARAVE|nr:hypothetical protein AVEN_156652-1 [Araneus ventricosus]
MRPRWPSAKLQGQNIPGSKLDSTKDQPWTVNAARYCDTLTKLMSSVRRKRPRLLSRGVLFFISHFLFRLITGDETWVHNFTPDTTSSPPR